MNQQSRKISNVKIVFLMATASLVVAYVARSIGLLGNEWRTLADFLWLWLFAHFVISFIIFFPSIIVIFAARQFFLGQDRLSRTTDEMIDEAMVYILLTTIGTAIGIFVLGHWLGVRVTILNS